MIRKPDAQERRNFWKADAWHAASAAPVFRWVGHDSRYPRQAKLLMIAFLIPIGLLFLTIMGGRVLLLAAMIVAVGGLAGHRLRRILIYWSIRRYGAWRDMPPEMRAVLDNPTDLAEPPTAFAPLPPGFRPATAGGAQPQPKQRRWYVTAALVLVAPFVPLLSYVGLSFIAQNPIAAAALAVLSGAAYVRIHRSKVPPAEHGS